jgi:ATP-dependent protease HslVU (ClpYQ) peptidase subunit
MTTLLASRVYGQTVLCADRAISVDSNTKGINLGTPTSKIVQLHPQCAVASTGSAAVIMWLEEWVETNPLTFPKTPDAGQAGYRAVRAWWRTFVKAHRAELDQKDFTGMWALCATPWWIAHLDTHGGVIVCDDVECVLTAGSGGDFARGAYTAARHLGANQAFAANWAMIAAAELDKHTSTEYDTLTWVCE